MKLRKVKVLVHCAETLVSWGPLTTGEQIKEENPRVMENWRDPTTKLHAHCSRVSNFLLTYFFAEKRNFGSLKVLYDRGWNFTC